jgi:hypothetical protein
MALFDKPQRGHDLWHAAQGDVMFETKCPAAASL